MPGKAIKIVLVLSSLFLVGLATTASAQNRFTGGSLPDIPKLEGHEVKTFMDNFRNQRLSSGDYSFRFYLRNMPRRGADKYYYGIMWGTWNELGPLTRVRVWEENSDDVTDFLLQNGFSPTVWVSRNGAEPTFVPKEAWNTPLMPGLEYTAFDFLMPFIFWDDYVYEGGKRVKGRPAQVFLMGGEGRLAIDSSYRALIRADILSDKGDIAKTFKIIDFKKVEDEWIVKSIDLVNEENRDKTRFQVTAVALGLHIEPAYFDEAALGKMVPMVDADQYISIH